MTGEQFERERRYRVAISIAHSMLRCGVITKNEYRMINARMAEKYRPLFGNLAHFGVDNSPPQS